MNEERDNPCRYCPTYLIFMMPGCTHCNKIKASVEALRKWSEANHSDNNHTNFKVNVFQDDHPVTNTMNIQGFPTILLWVPDGTQNGKRYWVMEYDRADASEEALRNWVLKREYVNAKPYKLTSKAIDHFHKQLMKTSVV